MDGLHSEPWLALNNPIWQRRFDDPPMTKLPLPLTVENRVPQKGVCVKTDSNSDQSDHAVVENLQSETTLTSDDFSTLKLTNITDEEPAFPGSEERKRIKPSPALDIPFRWGLTCVCGRSTEMEDCIVALPHFLSFPPSMVGNHIAQQHLSAHVFGVYDGHGGSQVASYCRDRLHLVLAEEMGIAKGNWRSECNWEEEWMNIFLNCFRKLDDEVEGCIGAGSVGSTAVVAVVCSTHVIVANCGDSRAVLCRGKAAVPLSVDHKPNREDEWLRIEGAGGRVIKWDGYRVSGFLAVSRSIGDRYLRPYVVADPEVMIVGRAKEDECLILASDGLWDVVTNEEACDLARRSIMLWDKKTNSGDDGEAGGGGAAQDAADCLLRLALHRGSRDNISVIVVDLKAPRKFKNAI